MNNYNSAAYPAASSGNPLAFLILFVLFLAMYCYMSYAFMVMARKTRTPYIWMAWVPVANTFLLIMMAKKPLWWFILLLVPLVNIVIGIILWMKVAENLNKPSWFGILMFVPLVNIIIFSYLAFSSSVPAQIPPAAPAV